jgi:hypothetical protein
MKGIAKSKRFLKLRRRVGKRLVGVIVIDKATGQRLKLAV